MKFKYLVSIALVVSLITVSSAYALEKSQKVFFFNTNEMPESGGILNQQVDIRVNESAILDNNVLSISVKEPYVYFGTHVGVSRFDLSSFEFEHFREGIHNLAQTVATSNSVNGTVWVGRAGGFSKIQDERMTNLSGTVFDDLLVYSSYVDRDGIVWFATNRDVHTFDKEDKWGSYSYANGHIPTSSVYAIYRDTKGGTWLGGNGIFYLEPGKRFLQQHWTIYSPQDTSLFHVSSITEADGWIWFGTNRGAFRRKRDTNIWEHIADASVLADLQVTSLATDRAGTVWIGTRKGMYSYAGNQFFPYTTTNGLVDNYVNTIVPDGNGLWIGTKRGVSRLKDGKWITITRDGVVDIELTLTSEQEAILDKLERQEDINAKIAERQLQTEFWEGKKGTFDDLRRTETWAAEFVFDLHERGVFKKDGKFRPLDNVTREELVKMAVVASGYSISEADTSIAPFLDVPEGHWAVPYINVALDENIIDRGKVFDIGRQVTRAESVEMLLRAFNVRLTEPENSQFSDVSGAEARWVDTAAALGIIKGYEKQIAAKVPASQLYSLPRLMKPGSQGENVRHLQIILKELGFYPDDRDITGFFDGPTTDAVADYQVARGILPKWTNGQFTEGLGAAGTATRNTLIKELVSTGQSEGVERTFDPRGRLTRAQMAKIIFMLVHLNSDSSEGEDTSEESDDSSTN